MAIDNNQRSMIGQIFGRFPRELRQKELEEQQKTAAALVKQGANPFGATFGVAFGAELGKGLLSRLGLESAAMQQARAAEEQAKMFQQDLATAREKEDYDNIINTLIGVGAPTDSIRLVQKMRDDAFPAPTMPSETSAADATRVGKLVASILDREGMTPEKLEESGYYVDLAQRAAVAIATQKDKVKRGEQDEPLTESQLLEVLVSKDIEQGRLRPSGSIDVGKTDMIFVKPKVQEATTPDGRKVFIQEDYGQGTLLGIK